ncbi:MAG: mechanosensitive ion channel family protein [Dehalococcoidia bacterium]|nr:mechanosensitive ion channel family protein [Dehalococcoidia bacterium]
MVDLTKLQIFSLEWLKSSGISILIAIVIALVLYLLLRHFVPLLIKKVVSQRMRGESKAEIEKRAETLSSFFTTTGTILIATFAIFTILPEFGVNIAAALAGLGIAGIAVSFGAQSLIKDILSGVFIILEDPYRIGDWIKIAGTDGLVEEISLRRTVLRDFDGTVHSIPNSEIKTASNFTRDYARVNMNIAVAYGEDLDHVIEVINSVCREMAEDPEWKASFLSTPRVLRVDNLGDSGIDIRLLGDTRPMLQWSAMGELRLRIKKAFDKEGIEMPWPHTKVYFGNSLPKTRENPPGSISSEERE